MKPTYIFTSLAILFSLLFSSCSSSSGHKIRGEGPVTTKTYILNRDFNQLEAQQAWDVRLIKSDTAKVVIKTQENIHDYITPKVKNGKLVIGFDQSANFRQINIQEAEVYYKSIESIKSSSASQVRIEDTLTQKEISFSASSAGSITATALKVGATQVKASSAAEITLEGTSINLSGKASSASTINASALKTKKADLQASSASNITINVLEEITAKASSGAKIKYSGQPKLKNTKQSSGGHIEQN